MAASEDLQFLDKLIAVKREQLQKAEEIAKTIPALSTDLAALERVRALASSNGRSAPPPPVETVDLTEPLRQTGVVLNVLRAAGRPIVLDEIMAGVLAAVPTAKRNTIMGHLSRFVEQGRARRTAPSTYEFVK